MTDSPTPTRGNLVANLPAAGADEHFVDLVRRPGVRIERIVSHGQTSAPEAWYDQDEAEWVMVVEGAARLDFDGGPSIDLGPGDWVDIPAHRRHRVAWTDPDRPTVWLAVFYPP